MREIFILVFIGGISIVGLVVIAFSFDPVRSDAYVKFLFYFLLFALFWSLGTFGFYYFGKKDELQFEMAFKKGLLLSFILLAIFIWLRIK